MRDDGSEGDCSAGRSGSLKLIQDYEYDYLDRLVSYGTFSNGTRTDHAEYVYDALSRVASEVEEHPSFVGDQHITQFSYLGQGGLETQEQQTSKNSGNTLALKDFTYERRQRPRQLRLPALRAGGQHPESRYHWSR